MPEWQDADEAQHLQDAQNGDAEAFGLLYEHYAPVLFRFLYTHLNDRLDAEDLSEEVFYRVWRSLASYRDQGVPFVAYLFRVARNALIDHYRRSSRSEQSLVLEEDILKDPNPEPSDAVATNIQRQEIRELLEKLREDYRTVLLLRFMGDLSPEETAEVMGKSPGAIRVLQHRALAALRNLMGSEQVHQDDNGKERD